MKRLRRQTVEVDFEGGSLTAGGGLVLLREVNGRLALIRRIDQAIPDPRDPTYTLRYREPSAQSIMGRYNIRANALPLRNQRSQNF